MGKMPGGREGLGVVTQTWALLPSLGSIILEHFETDFQKVSDKVGGEKIVPFFQTTYVFLSPFVGSERDLCAIIYVCPKADTISKNPIMNDF